MKLLLAVVRDAYASDVLTALSEMETGVTRISTTGGFWRKGNVTLVVGVEEAEIEKVLEVINQHAGPPIDAKAASKSHPPSRATIFVVDVSSAARY